MRSDFPNSALGNRVRSASASSVDTRPFSRNVSRRVNVPTRAAIPHQGSHSCAPISPMNTDESAYALQKLSKKEPNGDWSPRARATIPSTQSENPLRPKKAKAKAQWWDTKKYAEAIPKRTPENESRFGGTPAAARARPNGLASLESISLKVSMLLSSQLICRFHCTRLLDAVRDYLTIHRRRSQSQADTPRIMQNPGNPISAKSSVSVPVLALKAGPFVHFPVPSLMLSQAPSESSAD